MLSVDHRVIDGGPAARAIRIIGETLNGAVLDEFRGLVPSLRDSDSLPVVERFETEDDAT
jgi:hypothetical protein